MRYAGPCVGGSYAGQNQISETSRWTVYKSLFPTMRDIELAAKVMPDIEVQKVLLGHYVWDTVNGLWRWEKALPNEN
jgi:hypothetical protein